MKLLFLIIALNFLIFSNIVAQSYHNDTTTCDMKKCYCVNDLTPAGVMISHVHDKNVLMFGYRLMSMNMSGHMRDAKAISNATILKDYQAAADKMHMQMQMIMLMYGISNRLTVMAMVPYQTNYMEMRMKMGDIVHEHSMKTEGVGDIKVIALYAIFKDETSQCIVNGGINLPTGANNLKGSSLDMMYPSARLPYSMQLGSGSYDVLPGISYIVKKEKLAFSSQFNSTVRLKNNLLGYRLGNEYNLNSWLAYSWLPFISNSIRVDCIHVESIKKGDPSLNIHAEPSSNFLNYGGNYINTYLGTVMQFEKKSLNKFRLSFEYGIPIYQNVNGIQMNNKPSYSINASINF